jgi:O-methyltransferase involved in polyketide biosynthesis
MLEEAAVSSHHSAITGISPDVPNVARIYDYFLGGKDNFAADRAAAAKIAEAAPHVVQRAKENRAFLGRAVEFAAGEGIRQFVDIGTGLPTQENVHEVARRRASDARVAYVDHDPIVVTHARAILATDPRTIAVKADLREPEMVLREVVEGGFIDFKRPVAILMVAVLHFLADSVEVKRALTTYREAMAPGSYLIITHATAGDMSGGNLAKALQTYATTSAGGITLRSHEQITDFFDGMELQEPGLVPVAFWRPAGLTAPSISGPTFLGGVGLKQDGR